eukprot:GHVS01043585.1.p1 GENE.GHVS01043585.1~~GHVS01043585.1.p1  ORF type:complete len:378 (-),score=58.76 GHVS01043585.1:361-1494(-)
MRLSSSILFFLLGSSFLTHSTSPWPPFSTAQPVRHLSDRSSHLPGLLSSIGKDCFPDVQMPANRWNFYFLLLFASVVTPHPLPPLQPVPNGYHALPASPTAASLMKFANPSLQRLLPSISSYLSKLFSSPSYGLSVAFPSSPASQPLPQAAPGECTLDPTSAAFGVTDSFSHLSAVRFSCEEGPISVSVKSKVTDRYQMRCQEGRLVVGGRVEGKVTNGTAHCKDKQTGQTTIVPLAGTNLLIGTSSSSSSSATALQYVYHLSPSIDFYFTLLPHELLPAVKCGRKLYDPYWTHTEPAEAVILPRAHVTVPSCNVQWPEGSQLRASCPADRARRGWCDGVERGLCDEFVERVGETLYVTPPKLCGPVVNTFNDFQCK